MNNMNATQQRAAAKEFADFWKGKGYEKGQTQPFWIGLLRVLGVADPERGYIEFEDRAHIDAAHGFIDGYIPATRVLVEQKSIGKNLRAGIGATLADLRAPLTRHWGSHARKARGGERHLSWSCRDIYFSPFLIV